VRAAVGKLGLRALVAQLKGVAAVPQLSVTCPYCAQPNDIHASEATGGVSIACSHCQNRLGTWAQLKKGMPRADQQPADTAGSSIWWLDRRS
jgi:endogenous inhibitor of DNA gyrase (YacG/DUF329 family)